MRTRARQRLVCEKGTFRPFPSEPVRWMNWGDEDFRMMRRIGPQDPPLSREEWASNRAEGFHYCAVIRNRRIAALAAVWERTPDAWELSAVWTPDYRKTKHAKAVVSFATAHILEAGRRATYTHTAKSRKRVAQVLKGLGYRPQKSQ